MSILNPWVILSILFALGGALTGGYYKGVHSEQDRQKLVIATLNEQARAKEQALVTAVNNTATQLVKVNQDAKIQIAKRDAAISSGALKLRVPIKPTVCPVQAAGDPAPASGNSGQATAELDSEIARSLVAITDQGDANTRQLNACIDAYQALTQTLKGKP